MLVDPDPEDIKRGGCKAPELTEPELMSRLIEIANANHDGHLTVLKFTTNWRIGFGTPSGNEFIIDMHRMAVGATFAEAATAAIADPRHLAERPSDMHDMFVKWDGEQAARQARQAAAVLPHIAPEWREKWRKDCLHWRGRVLTGAQGHWCDEWDGLPVDETTPEWPCSCLPRHEP